MTETTTDTVPVYRGELAAFGLMAERMEGMLAELRGQLAHAEAALAGDNEGVRQWMLDCGHLVDKHREHATEVSIKLGRIRELAEGWTADDGWGEPTSEMRLQAECGRAILGVIAGVATDGSERALGASGAVGTGRQSSETAETLSGPSASEGVPA